MKLAFLNRNITGLFFMTCVSVGCSNNAKLPPRTLNVSTQSGGTGNVVDRPKNAGDTISVDSLDPKSSPNPNPDSVDPITPAKGFVVGYNEAWFRNYWNSSLAPDKAMGIMTSDFDLAYLKSTFQGIKKAGGSIVRFWLVMDMEGLILKKDFPQTQGLEPEMLKNIETLLQVAKENELVVYFTILEMNDQKQDVPLHEQTYYFNLFNNKYGEGDAFNKNALLPILQLLNSYQSLVYGIDVYNEIQFAVANGFFEQSWDGARAWIKGTTAFIKTHSPWANVTATADDQFITQGLLSGLGLDFYDLHQYADEVKPSDYNSVCQKAKSDGLPIILGEYGHGSPDSDLVQLNATASFLSAAKASCFTAALAWRYDAGEGAWNYVRDDGSMRPATNVIIGYSQGNYNQASVTSFNSDGNVGIARCGNTWDTPKNYLPDLATGPDCYKAIIGSAKAFPNCSASYFGWRDGNIYETRCGCGNPGNVELGDWVSYTENNLSCFKKVLGPVMVPLK